MTQEQTNITRFEKSSRSIAAEKSIHLAICIVGALMFAGPILLVEGVSTMALIGLIFGSIIALLLAVVVTREILTVLSSDESWWVSVSDNQLIWHSPVEKQMSSFSIDLIEIQSVQRHKTRFRNSKRNPKIEHFINLGSGKKIKIDGQKSGINPSKVFDELEKRGLRFDKTDEWKGSGVKFATSS
ncbi:MAG: hypothetical protein ABJH43_13865 [Tateyamaria sp.]